jgi:hypothetical protein
MTLAQVHALTILGQMHQTATALSTIYCGIVPQPPAYQFPLTNLTIPNQTKTTCTPQELRMSSLEDMRRCLRVRTYLKILQRVHNQERQQPSCDVWKVSRGPLEPFRAQVRELKEVSMC